MSNCPIETDIENTIADLRKQDPKMTDIEADKLREWLKANGVKYKIAETLDEYTMDYKHYKGDIDYKDDPLYDLTVAIEKANQTTSAMLQNMATNIWEVAGVKSKFKDGHAAMMQNELYKTAWEIANDINDHNILWNQLKTYTGIANDMYDKMDFSKMLTVRLHAAQARNEQDNAKIEELENRIKDAYKGEEVPWDRLNDVYAESGLFNLSIYGNELNRLVTGEANLDVLMREIELRGNVSKEDIEIAKNMGHMWIHGPDNENPIANTTVAPWQVATFGTERHNDIARLATLAALTNVEGAVDLLRDMYANKTELYVEMVNAGVVNATSTYDMYKKNGDVANMSQMGNLVKDIYQTPYELQMITLDDIRNQKYTERDGWQELRTPTEGKVGFVYRKKTGEFNEGIGLNVGYLSNGYKFTKLPDGVELENNNISRFTIRRNLQQTGKLGKVEADTDMYIAYLTKEEKNKLERLNNPAHTLLRSFGHTREINDMKIVRDAILKNKTFSIVTEKDVEKLVEIMADQGRENPWYLDTSNARIDEWSRETRIAYNKAMKKYVKSKHITDIGNLNQQLTHTRADMASMLDGYMGLQPDAYRYRVALDLLKKVVAWTKIQQIIVNPVKIAMDFASNTSYLVARGGNIVTIVKGYGESIPKMKELTRLRNEYVGMEFQQYALEGKELIKHLAKMKRLEKKIREHELAPMLFNGMIQSIGTDITLKSYDTVSGLDNDMKLAIKKLVRDDKGELNKIGTAIVEFSKAGGDMMDMAQVMASLAKKTKNNPFTQPMSEVFENFSKNISKAKSDEDVEKYVGEFIGAPGSELVKLGSALTQWSDVLPRIELYKYNKNVAGMTEEEAVLDVLDAFVDYRMNMPPEIKFMSDTFFMMYPSFWMKIQKVIFQLAKTHPLGVGNALLMAEILNTQGLSIMGANLITKANHGTLIDAPEISDLTFFLGHLY